MGKKFRTDTTSFMDFVVFLPREHISVYSSAW